MSISGVRDKLLNIADLFEDSSLTRTATSIFITFKKVLKYEQQQEIPIDCGGNGHRTKNNSTGPQYVEKSGHKRKRKDDLQNKKDKYEGKKAFKRAISDPNKKKSACASCGANDHFSSRSRLCRNHKESLQDTSIRIAGMKREEFVRRVPFSAIVHPQYHDEL
ncbi:hypothetical protein VKS41_008867 [Umbelopsis sp. WA50703]